MSDALIAASIGAVVTVCGWFATYLYAKRMEDRRRRLEAHLLYRSQQIEQLYGPLLSLIEQVFNVWQVREKILESCECSTEQQRAIRELVWKRYFTPLHSEIAALLRTKLYLLDGSNLPESFASYLKHALQEECLKLLWAELQFDATCVPGLPWPQEFYSEVKGTLLRLMEERKQGLARLHS
ncbi:MAG TPA: hypothetical protein VGN17_13515 [Bryobacteraceae bacterium]|jgi:hypothetical protein